MPLLQDTTKAIVELVIEGSQGLDGAPGTELSTQEPASGLTEDVVDLPRLAILRAEAISEMGQVFSEALTFTSFLARSKAAQEPPVPSRVEQAQSALESSLSFSGVDVSTVKSRAAEAKTRAFTKAAEASRGAGSAVNRLFGLGRKAPSEPSQPPRTTADPAPVAVTAAPAAEAPGSGRAARPDPGPPASL